ncbi:MULTISPECIES: hypothetical protein [unclassified Myroides]|uniref:hypothetical protein n=1 Tax=unclassified Myroides TaxID=2642485 RepID=UPI003D2F881D
MIKKNISRFIALISGITLLSFPVYGQEKETQDKVIWFRNTGVFFGNSFYFGDNMIADSHRLHNMGAEIKLGIAKYKNVGLTLFTGFTTLKVDDTRMIGEVNSSKEVKGGASVFYQMDITEKSTFKPELGIYDVSFTSTGVGIDVESMSGTGFLIGTDYQYNLTARFRTVVGLHYHWNTYNVKTASQYKNYFERAQFIQLSVGINF